MHPVLVIVLVGSLATAVVSFVVLGLRRWRRTAGLAARAQSMGLRFSPDDPFDVPRRYRQFPVICSGHSPLAENVSYGRVDGWPVRAMQFHHENGHGTRRLTKHYSIIIFELGFPLPAATLWNDRDLADAPLEVRPASGRLDCWAYGGDAEFARLFTRLAGNLGKDGFSVQTLGQSIFFSVVEKRTGGFYTDYIRPIIAVLENLPQAGQRAETGRA
ncbi:MAG: hypothetical protein HZA50_06170 [Planctomycetes bacterium]|nr:hypothetical protein [Planctomycetota bacterium]